MRFHGTDVRQKALTQLRNGARNADVARQLNVPPGTISYWKHADRAKRGECPGRHNPRCTRCDASLDGPAYAYLPGLYPGDGHIVQSRAMGSPSLSITCTESWTGLMDNCEAAMRTVFPNNSVCRVRRKGCWEIKPYSKHLWCLFPQHGPGMKHTRKIALEPWQQAIAGERKRYEYPRYFFTNTPADIIRLFTDTPDRVGVERKPLTQSRAAVTIPIARKASVALMDLHVGPTY